MTYQFELAASLPVAEHRVCYHSCSSGRFSLETNEHDDSKKEFRIVQYGKFYKNEILQTKTEKYEILTLVGEGTFGDVLLGWSYPTKEYVAIKVLKDRNRLAEKAAREIAFLRYLKEANGSQFNLLKFHCAFICKKQYCLAVEVLEQSLFTFMVLRKHQPLHLYEIRPILRQIFVALVKLQELQIVHTDIKPENIMFVNNTHAPHRIKIVDFGNAITLNECRKYRKLQTIYYRAPEVILGAPVGHAIDIWSVGCIAAELYLGSILYKGYTTYDQIRLMYETQGCLPLTMLERGVYSKRYFNTYGRFFWLLKTPNEYRIENNTESKDYCRYRFASLNGLFDFGPVGYVHYTAFQDKLAFIDLVKQMLSLSDGSRIRPIAALQHSFTSMRNLIGYYHSCNYVREGFQIMKNIQFPLLD